MPDHATPISIRTHTDELVPFAIMGMGIEQDCVQAFDEEVVKKGGYREVDGVELMELLAKS